MIETTDIKVIVAIDNIRNTVGDVCEEGHLYPLEEVVNVALDIAEVVTVTRMLVAAMRSFGDGTNNGEELAGLISTVMEEAGIEPPRFSYSHQSKDAKAEDQSKATEANKEGIQEEDTRKRVVLYTPGLFPKASLEDMSEGIFDSKDPGYREMRFADTDLLICFNDDDVCHLWGNSYLTGPSMIFAVDENEEMRSLEDDEVFKVLSVIIHKEEHFGMKKMPIFRLC